MYEVRMPQMGQSVEEASIVQWLKKEGDTVAKGDPLFSIQTDKAEIECESPADGVLLKILLQPDVTVPVLSIVALIGAPGEPLPDIAVAESPAPPATEESPATVSVSVPVDAPASESTTKESAFASPRARAKAADLGVNLGAVQGTGPRGRIRESDVVAASDRAGAVRATPTARRVAVNLGVDVAAVAGTGPRGKVMKADVAASVPPKAPVPVPSGGVERVPLTKMRKTIARRMAESKYAAPHYYMTVEIDMFAAKAFRATCVGFKPSFNDLVLSAAVKALREFPAVNARWAGDAIERVADINLGVAVALPEGLIVPVLRQAQQLSLEGLSTQARVLAEKARAGKLLPDDYVGNTFTISNLGPFGVDDFTAIINQPDSAILAVGQMKDRVVAINGGIHIRPIMKITMSSDHRVIDGALAAQFLSRLKAIIEAGEF